MRALVYRAYNADDELLYIGVTGNLPERMKGHRSERPWWRAEVARVEHDALQPRGDAYAAEREQIQRLQPKYNERRWFADGVAVYSLRVDGAVLNRLTEIAAWEGLTVAAKLRLLIEEEIARHADAIAATQTAERAA